MAGPSSVSVGLYAGYILGGQTGEYNAYFGISVGSQSHNNTANGSLAGRDRAALGQIKDRGDQHQYPRTRGGQLGQPVRNT